MSYPPASERITRGGQTLSARVWALLEDAYRAAGLDPDAHLTVVQGSWSGGSVEASGSTHDGGGAFDVRTRDLPAAAQADLCGRLVVELRRRNVCAWYRDQAHGGMSPHIHGIVRDEPGLSSGARWQVTEYDANGDGLNGTRPDYHPRPTQRAFQYPPAPRVLTTEDGHVIFQTHQDSKPDGQGIGTGRHYLVLGNGKAVRLTGDYKSDGVPIVKSATEQTDKAFFGAVQRYEGE